MAPELLLLDCYANEVDERIKKIITEQKKSL